MMEYMHVLMLGPHDLNQDTNILEIQNPFNQCVERQCPLIRTGVTGPPAPWIRTPHIEKLRRLTKMHVEAPICDICS